MFFCNPRQTCIQLQHHRMLTRELFQKEWIQSWGIWEDLGFSIPAIMLDDQNLFSLFIYTHLFLSALLCFGINEYSPSLYQPPVEMLPHLHYNLTQKWVNLRFCTKRCFNRAELQCTLDIETFNLGHILIFFCSRDDHWATVNAFQTSLCFFQNSFLKYKQNCLQGF